MVNYKPPLIGIIGKANVGKSTLFSALTMTPVEISNRPFTTIEPNHGVGYIRVKCPHVDFGLDHCDPRTGFCLKGYRFVPVELMDVAGLIPGAHKGRGLGNRFMDDLRRADAFIMVVDASGSTDEDGNPVEPGTRDPVEEVRSILGEVDMWVKRIIMDDWDRFSRTVETQRRSLIDALAEKLSGLSVKRIHVAKALEEAGLEKKTPSNWDENDFTLLAVKLRKTSKPLVIAANKVDMEAGKRGYERLKTFLKEYPVIPVSAVSELALLKASRSGLIEYVPGDPTYIVKKNVSLQPEQNRALEYIRKKVLEAYGETGVQRALRTVVYDALGKVIVFPVEDIVKLTDQKGNILPDALIVDSNARLSEIAGMIHTDLMKGFLYAVDAKTRKRLGEQATVYDRMVFKIVSGVRG